MMQRPPPKKQKNSSSPVTAIGSSRRKSIAPKSAPRMTETIISTTPQKNVMSIKNKTTPGHPPGQAILSTFPPDEFFSLSKLNQSNFTFSEVPYDQYKNLTNGPI